MRFYLETVRSIENLRARYEVPFLILPTGARFRRRNPNFSLIDLVSLFLTTPFGVIWNVTFKKFSNAIIGALKWCYRSKPKCRSIVMTHHLVYCANKIFWTILKFFQNFSKFSLKRRKFQSQNFWKPTSPSNAGEKVFFNNFSRIFKIFKNTRTFFKNSNCIFDNEKKIRLDKYVGNLERKWVPVCKIEKWSTQQALRFLIERTVWPKNLI